MSLDETQLNDYISTLTSHPEIAEIIQERLQKAGVTSIEEVDHIADEVLMECHRETDEALLLSMRQGFRSQ